MEKRTCNQGSHSFPRNELVNFYSDGDCGGEELLYCPDCARAALTFMAFDSEQASVDPGCGARQACTPGGSRSRSDDFVRQEGSS